MSTLFTERTVTVVTAATGHHNLKKCVWSVIEQTCPLVQHWIVVDGTDRESAVRGMLSELPTGDSVRVIVLPDATGREGWCGHRIYGAAGFLCSSQYISFLDEDNWLEPEHIGSLMSAVENLPGAWGYSLRRIVDAKGNFIALDNCESLGALAHPVNDLAGYHIDTSCYLLPRELAVACSPHWYVKARPGDGAMEADRAVCAFLMEYFPVARCNFRHSLNYTVGSRADSVQARFFVNGNLSMHRRYPNGLPWKARDEAWKSDST